jgi:hypothetical protein
MGISHRIAGMGHVLAEVDEELYDRLRERAIALDRPVRDVVLDALHRATDDPLPPRLDLRVRALRAKVPLADKPYGPPDDADRARLVATLAGVGPIVADLVDDDRADGAP